MLDIPWYNVGGVLQRLNETETLEYIYDMQTTHLHSNHVPQWDPGKRTLLQSIEKYIERTSVTILENFYNGSLVGQFLATEGTNFIEDDGILEWQRPSSST